MNYKDNSIKVLNDLFDYLLGEDYTIVSPVSGNQAREIMADEVKRLYKTKVKVRKHKRKSGSTYITTRVQS